MEEKLLLTPGEWHIMECLWREAPKTVMQMVNLMKKETGWSKSTTVTMVRRMEAKGILRYEICGKTRHYYPTISRNDAAMRETDSLLSRVYRGSVGMLMSALVENRSFSEEEIQELYDILEKAEKRREK